MLHSLYYPTATALHKYTMQCSGIALETLGFTRGREPKAPLSPLGAHGSLKAYTCNPFQPPPSPSLLFILSQDICGALTYISGLVLLTADRTLAIGPSEEQTQ